MLTHRWFWGCLSQFLLFTSSAHTLLKYLDSSVPPPPSVSISALFFPTLWKFERCRVGSLLRVICHFVSCSDLGIVCLHFYFFFALIIMGCSLLLSHFLFIVLILAPGSSLTSQGCLRCGNQGKLYLKGAWSHLLTLTSERSASAAGIWRSW